MALRKQVFPKFRSPTLPPPGPNTTGTGSGSAGDPAPSTTLLLLLLPSLPSLDDFLVRSSDHSTRAAAGGDDALEFDLLAALEALLECDASCDPDPAVMSALRLMSANEPIRPFPIPPPVPPMSKLEPRTERNLSEARSAISRAVPPGPPPAVLTRLAVASGESVGLEALRKTTARGGDFEARCEA